jgi:hypothetical protein
VDKNGDCIKLKIELPGNDRFIGVLLSFIDEIENLGFFFCGVLPFGIDGNHAILYQYANMSVNFDLINLADGFSKEILSYIKKQAVF